MPKIASKIIARVSSDESGACPLCDFLLDGIHNFDAACNHLMQEHKLACLHVGQQTSHEDTGLWHCTVAVFGI
jgi:hypothetical protein